METIARIPAVAVQVNASANPAGRQPTSRRRGAAFPVRSIVVLAVLATVAWTLATWNEQDRMRRQRQPVRLAREPAANVRDSVTP
jgi:hypothetical protein